MAESSITHNFIITDQDEIERFAKILEESANDPPRPCPYEFKYLEDPDEIRECMEKLEQAITQRELARNCAANTSDCGEDWENYLDYMDEFLTNF